MNVAMWGTAIAAVTGVGARFGWIHALIAAMLLLCLWVTVNVVRNRKWMRESNGHEVSRDAAHHAADSLITTMAAAIGTPAARDLALEASNTLDEMAAAGTSGDELMRAARHLARQFPMQLRGRSRTDTAAPQVPSKEDLEAGHFLGAATWVLHTKRSESAVLQAVDIAHADGVGVAVGWPHRPGDGPTLVLTFKARVTRSEVLSVFESFVKDVEPYSDEVAGAPGPRTAG